MAATDAKPIPLKNTAYRATFPIYNGNGDLVAAATGLDSEVSIDGAAFVDCTNEATEIAAGSGIYFLDLTAAEMNADTVAVKTSSTSVGAKTTVNVFNPEEAGDIRVNATQVAGTPQTAGDLKASLNVIDDFLDTEMAAVLAAVDTEIGAIKAKTDALPGDPADQSLIVAATDAIVARLPAALSAGGNMKADLQEINEDATAANNLAKTTRVIGRGTAAAGGTTTSMPTSAFAPAGAAADQFKGRIIIFDWNTTTAALRGQATDITANTGAATPAFTMTALTTAPVSGDTFSVT
jgi:hypothetical protein